VREIAAAERLHPRLQRERPAKNKTPTHVFASASLRTNEKNKKGLRGRRRRVDDKEIKKGRGKMFEGIAEGETSYRFRRS